MAGVSYNDDDHHHHHDDHHYNIIIYDDHHYLSIYIYISSLVPAFPSGAQKHFSEFAIKLEY